MQHSEDLVVDFSVEDEDEIILLNVNSINENCFSFNVTVTVRARLRQLLPQFSVLSGKYISIRQ